MYKPALSLLILCLLWTCPLKAQTEPVDIDAGRFTIHQIIETVETQTRLSFAYDGSIVNINMPVVLRGVIGTVGNLLKIIEPQVPYSFTFYNRYILINPTGGIAQTAKPQVEPQIPSGPGTDTGEDTGDDMPDAGNEETLKPAEPVVAEVIPHDTIKVIVPKEKEPYSEYISPLASYRASQRTIPLMAIKTNLLYAGAALTPNLGFEIQVGDKSTVELSAGYNWYKREGTDTDNKKLVHWLIRPEYRYWFCQPYNGHFMGGHAFYGRYNISSHNLPLMFGKNSKDHRFEGDGFGVGVSYGYHLILGRQWNAEFTVGAGYARLNYEKFACDKCSREIGKFHRNYFGPTRLGVTLVFLIK